MTTKTHNPADKVERWKIEKLVPYARKTLAGFHRQNSNTRRNWTTFRGGYKWQVN